MTSVNTNVAAITALRTLQQTNNQLDATQGRISTGLKIGEAKDNAAYWAISTTLKSDNKSLATVKDALGLGSATVDVAYQGLNKAKDVLDEIKAKLTAASQAGVDKNVIQAEIGELQKQLVSIAGSSVFSGENWLSVDSSAVDYDATKKIVASFARDANNSVTIGTVDVAIGNVALFDSSTVKGKNGILDGAISLKGTDGRDLDLGTANTDGNTVVAGLTKTTGAATETGSNGTAITAAAGAARGTTGSGNTVRTYAAADVNVATGTAGDVITVTVAKSTGGAPVTFDVTLSDAGAGSATAQSILDDIRGATTGSTAFTFGGSSGAALTVSNATSEAASYSFDIVKKTGSGTYSMDTVAAAPGYTPGTKATVSTTALTLSEYAVGDKITVTLDVSGTPTTVTTGALTGTAINDIRDALDTALAGFADVTNPGTTVLKFDAAADGLQTSFGVTSFVLKDADGKIKSATGVPSATAGKHQTGAFTATTLDADDNLYFKIQVDNATAATNITIDQALVNKTLSTNTVPVTDGKIGSASDFAKVINAALKNANITGATASATSGSTITFSSATAGTSSKVVVSDIAASAGADTVTIDTIDISDAGLAKVGATSGADISKVMSAYISAVNSAINKVTTAASNLGAVASRIDMQKSFVNTLMDTIDKGVGGLIDADMSEESTKLQALQVKQSLGVQALSIANQSSQNILRLFQ